MSSIVAVAIAALAGISAAAQSAMNATVGKTIGSVGSTLATFIIGTVVTLIAVLCVGRTDFAKIGDVPPFYWFAGVLGVIIVFAMIVAVPRVGLATATTALVVAQIATAVIVDHFGLLGVDRIPATPLRLLGVALLVVSLRLVFR